jgi:hypothetical protein
LINPKFRGFSTWRPVQFAACQHVDMQVGDSFAAIGAVVDDEAETAFGESLASGDFCGGQEEVSEDFLIGSLGFGDPDDGFARNDEQVDRCLRRDVSKADTEIVLVNDIRRNLPIADFFKKRLVGHESRKVVSGRKSIDSFALDV